MNWINRIETAALAGVLFSLPLGLGVGRIMFFILLMVAFGLLVLILSGKRKISLTRPVKWYAFSMAIYVAVFTAGLIADRSLKQESTSLALKSTFLTTTIFFLLSDKEIYSRRNLKMMFGAYLIGLNVNLTFSLVYSFIQSLSFEEQKLVFQYSVEGFDRHSGISFLESVTQGGNYFFGNYIANFVHNSYLALFFVFGLFLVLYYNIRLKEWILFRREIYILPIVFVLMVFLLNSRAGVLSLGMFTLVLMADIILSVKDTRSKIFILVGLTTITVILVMNPRIKTLAGSMQDYLSTVEKLELNQAESTALRFSLWTTSLEMIRDKPVLGYGPAKYRHELTNRVTRYNEFASEANLNAHNQFLEALLSQGVMGLMALLGILFVPILFHTRNKSLMFIVLIFIFNCLFESMFERLWGILFYTISLGIFIKQHEFESGKTSSVS